MEIRARYVLMGSFLLAVIVGVFGFIYWLENSGGFQDRKTYRITFDGPVSGLYTGSSVLFNGIRVGEVTALRIAADRPKEVAADIDINATTPIRQDTEVDLEYQGLTGVASISLSGGEGDSLPVDAGDGVPVLEANQGAGLTMTQSARDALLKLHGILDDNSQPLKQLIGNLNDFSGALSRNSDKVDGILAGLERMTGGKRGPGTEKVYDLSAAELGDDEAGKLRGQLTVSVPSALFQLDTQNILFRQTREAAPLPPGARWADNLTRLVQAKIAQSFENAGYIDSVSHSDAIIGEYQLLIDIRRFQMLTEPEPRADIAYTAKIADSSSAILDAKLFEGSVEAASDDAEQAVRALNAAFQQTAAELVIWVGQTLSEDDAPQQESSVDASESVADEQESAATDEPAASSPSGQAEMDASGVVEAADNKAADQQAKPDNTQAGAEPAPDSVAGASDESSGAEEPTTTAVTASSPGERSIDDAPQVQP